MEYQRWLWLLTALGWIGLGVAIAMVVPAWGGHKERRALLRGLIRGQ
jgi:hypothetical protein